MKKLFFAIASMFVAMACVTDGVEVSTPQLDLVPVELSVEDSATRLDVDGNVVKWEVGDKISVMFKGASTTQFVTFEITDASQIVSDGKCAKFRGMVPAGSYSRAVALYPGVATGSDSLAVNEHASQNVYMGGVVDYADNLVVAEGKSVVVTMTLAHLMHKIDYKLTGDVNYNNIAVEMVASSNDTTLDLIQFGGYDMYSGEWSIEATTKSHFSGIIDHNFASEPVASSMIFPFEATNVTLLFNVYIDGKKQYAIEKGPLSSFKMSAGKSSTINLALTEDNKVKEESSSGGSGPTIDSDFNPDYYITTFMSGVSGISGSYGIGFRAYVNGSYVDVHIPATHATTSSINEGDYTWTSSSWFGYNSFVDFTVRNGAGLYALGLKNTTSLKEGQMVVSKVDGKYVIDITLTDTNSTTKKIQYIGELNVENGGYVPTESGGSGGSGSGSGSSDIELNSLTAQGVAANGCYSFAGVDANGNTIDLYVNTQGATVNTISRGLYEFTNSTYANNEALFYANNLTINGSAKSGVVSGMMHVTSASSNNVNLSVNLNFDDGTSQRYTFGGVISNVADNNLYLIASKSSIVGSGNDYTNFTVTQAGADVTLQCTIYINGSATYDANFSSTTPGTYTVYAQKDGVKSNELTITVEEYVVLPITLTASKTSLVANSVDSVTFTVKQDNTDITTSAEIYVNGVRNNGSTFTAATPGTYTVYAQKDGVKSNELTITVEEYVVLPITLTASKTSLVANSVDSVTFTVKQDNTDITTSAEIYVNGVRNNGSTFTAASAGTYSVYAMYQGVKSNTVTLTATAPDPSNYEIVFADGVSSTTGWYDVNKKATGLNGDINMCWAAASSNIIQWWQDRYVAAGNTLPSGAISGPGTTSYTNYGPYELELMNMFLTQWNNEKGGHMEQAIPWYFEGVLNGGELASSGSQAYPLTAGGYFSSVWSSITPYMYRGYDSNVGYATCYNNYYIWGNGSSYTGTDRLKKFSDLVVEAFEHGMAGLTISLSATLSSTHHATTLWGYEIDKTTGLLTRVWITDSDDLEDEPKSQILNEYTVSIGTGNSQIKLSGGSRYGACYVVSLHPISGYGSASN